MTAFRDGEQPATVMQQLAKGLDDHQIDVLGESFEFAGDGRIVQVATTPPPERGEA